MRHVSGRLLTKNASTYPMLTTRAVILVILVSQLDEECRESFLVSRNIKGGVVYTPSP